MLGTQVIAAAKMSCRYICTSAIMPNKQSANFLNKFLNPHKKRKSKTDKTVFGKAIPSLSVTDKNRDPRRVTALNKIFMKHITDLMATGEVGASLIGKGIEITHIKVATDYKLINVYWFSQSKEDIETTEQLLHNCASDLRHELIRLRVIGVIPPIYFVKNKHMSSAAEVEQKLATVDYGEDFEPTYKTEPKQEIVLKTTLHPDIRKEISKLNDQNDDDDNYNEIILPEMPQDTLGLNHHAIMSKIRISVNKTKDAHIRRMNLPPPSPIDEETRDVSQMLPSFVSNNEETEIFADFLKKRKIEEKRRRREYSVRHLKAEYEQQFTETMDGDNNNWSEDFDDVK